MAAVSTTFVSFVSSSKPPIKIHNQKPRNASNLKMAGVGWGKKGFGFPSPRTSRFHICCAVAKPETVQKVCEIVRKQLALPAETEVTPDSKFAALGADSLDTVEIVMGLEEEFGINVEEQSSENITTVQEAADMIEKLVQEKPPAAS